MTPLEEAIALADALPAPNLAAKLRGIVKLEPTLIELRRVNAEIARDEGREEGRREVYAALLALKGSAALYPQDYPLCDGIWCFFCTNDCVRGTHDADCLWLKAKQAMERAK